MTRHSADNFITRLYPAAVQASQDTGLSWELMLAQAALETRWGRQGSLADTHNLFNIKADRQWKGPQQQVHVWEVEGGRTRWQHDGFRVYPDEAASLQDRNRFLQTQPRYARAGLLQAQLWMERAATATGVYPTNADLTKVLPANLSWSSDSSKRYQLEMKSSSNAAYTLIAKRKNPSPQATDKCGDFTLSNTGVKSADNLASSTTAIDCWSK